MDQQYHLLSGIINFLSYFGLGLILIIFFKFLYAAITPHNEWQLIKQEKNIAAAIAFGGAIIGFAIALSGAASNSVSIVDFLTWGLIALGAQLLAFAVVRFIFMPKIIQRIKNGEASAGTMLAATNISVGMLNAACMSY